MPNVSSVYRNFGTSWVCTKKPNIAARYMCKLNCKLSLQNKRLSRCWTRCAGCEPAESITPALSQFLSPKRPPTGDNRQIGEQQPKGQAHHEAERADPSRYGEESQNVGDENVGVELDGVRHDAGIYRSRHSIANEQAHNTKRVFGGRPENRRWR